MIQISCADYAFPLLPRERRFALLQLLGFEYVDIGLFERSDGLRPGQLLAEPKKFSRQLKRDLIHAGLRASDIFLQTGSTPLDSPDNDPSLIVRSRNRKTFVLALELCAELECTHLTGLPGIVHKGIGEKDSLELAVEEIRWRQRVASSSGVCYAIKPCVDSLCSSVDQVRALLEAVPGLTLTLDYGHFVMSGEDSAAVHSLLPFASHVHVRGGAPNRLQTSVAENTIDFTGMVAGLKRTGFEGFLTLEYVWIDWNDCNRTDNISETVLLRDALKSAAAGTPAEL